ncbi:MAG: trimethylamine methyltransferase family protein [Pseudomonadota bacterium]
MDAAQRANAIWTKQLNDYVAPELDQAVDEQLVAFMEQRRAVLPDSVS